MLLSLGSAVFALHALLLGLVCWGRLTRPLLAVLLVVTAVAHWYMTRYAVVFDVQMEILLVGLQQEFDAAQGDALVVLYMLGNHGPTYFERYPPRFERWRPVCRSDELNRCPIPQIVNAYDNAILYTDAVLGRLIDLLARQAGRDTAMLYLSDHGESLGEYGLFLHGAPYSIAPRAQLHVPMTLWMSPHWVASVGLDLTCLHKMAAQPTSHDALFSTVLGAFDVRTAVYRRDHDLLAPCRTRG